MSPTVYDVRDQLRETALDERVKGDLFERLVQAILEADPYWTQRFTTVDRWANWEGRQASSVAAARELRRASRGQQPTPGARSLIAPLTFPAPDLANLFRFFRTS
jgi:hypothetical protein